MAMKHLNYLMILCLISLGLYSCSSPEIDESTGPTVPVVVAKATLQDIPDYLDGVGFLKSLNEVDLNSQVTGLITSIGFYDGSFVTKGQLLYTIEPNTYQAALARALGILAQDEANLALAKIKVKRFEDLYKKEYFSAVEYEALVQNVKSLEGTIEADKADIQAAKIRLDWTKITSPLDGYISDTQFYPGAYITAGTSQILSTVRQVQPIFAHFSIPERFLLEIRTNQALQPLKILAYFQNATEPSLEGILDFIQNTVDKHTGTIQLRAKFQNDDIKGWPGQYVQIKLLLKTIKDAVTVPETAIIIASDNRYIYIIKDDMTAELRKVEVGINYENQIVILSGIKEGETVVTDGQLNLHKGSKVNIIQPQQASSPP